jgi:hypothetical protein
MWRLWAKALGDKASSCSRESDIVALIRSLILLAYLVTNGFIVAGVLRNWNDNSKFVPNLNQIRSCGQATLCLYATS